MAHGNVIRVVEKFTKPFSQILTNQDSATISCKLITPLSSCLLCFLLNAYWERCRITLCTLLIKAIPQPPTRGQAVIVSQQQIYITWHNESVLKHGYSTSLLRTCQHAVLLWVGSPHCSTAWLSLGYVSRYGGVFAEKREKMRDRSHSQRAVPEWCCSTPSSTPSTPNEKFQTSSEVTLESGNVFPPLLCPFLDNNFKS